MESNLSEPTLHRLRLRLYSWYLVSVAAIHDCKSRNEIGSSSDLAQPLKPAVRLISMSRRRVGGAFDALLVFCRHQTASDISRRRLSDEIASRNASPDHTLVSHTSAGVGRYMYRGKPMTCRWCPDNVAANMSSAIQSFSARYSVRLYGREVRHTCWS